MIPKFEYVLGLVFPCLNGHLGDASGEGAALQRCQTVYAAISEKRAHRSIKYCQESLLEMFSCPIR